MFVLQLKCFVIPRLKMIFNRRTLSKIDGLSKCMYVYIRVGYTTVWSGIYECNEYIPLQTMV